MSDLIEKAKAMIVKAMAYRFPKYPVRFESIEDDPRILGLGVFAVHPTDFFMVQDYVFDLETTVDLPDGWGLLPLVRDPSATSKHYPEILATWSVPMICNVLPYKIPVTGHTAMAKYSSPVMEEIPKSDTDWTTSKYGQQHKTTNHDFALAA